MSSSDKYIITSPEGHTAECLATAEKTNQRFCVAECASQRDVPVHGYHYPYRCPICVAHGHRDLHPLLSPGHEHCGTCHAPIGATSKHCYEHLYDDILQTLPKGPPS